MISFAFSAMDLNWNIELSSFLIARQDLISYGESSLYNNLVSWLESEYSSFYWEFLKSSVQYSIGSSYILVSITASTKVNSWEDVAFFKG